MSPDSAPLRISLLGGFEVWSAGEQVRGFESQKVRALFAYLVLRRDRALSRDHLAGMFWGDRDEESARRNLRQAIYNLKSTLPGESESRPHLVVDSQEVRFDGDSGCWIDVEAFERAAGRAIDSRGEGFRDLGGAVQLYRGDLLAGFLVKDCPQFEEWLLTAQERLRETALETLRQLVADCLARGDCRLGVQNARRLVEMDPLSEEAHRQLLRLYELAGQRGRALAHYTDLRELLRRELGVEPLAETRALHERILAAALIAEGGGERPAALGPIVPLAGRRHAFDRLAEEWQAVLEGGCRTTFLAGEEGIGKTRLARSFLGTVTARRRVTVLTGACRAQTPQPRARALAEALRSSLPEEPAERTAALAALPADACLALARLLPELAASGAEPPPASTGDLAAAVAAWLGRLGRLGSGEGEPSGEPLILFLDDLELADPATLAILAELPAALGDARVWLLAAVDPSALAADHPLHERLAEGGPVWLERLGGDELAEIAVALVGQGEADALAGRLDDGSPALPLAVATRIDALWDTGELVPRDAARWSLRGPASPPVATESGELDRAILGRLRRLPSSTRRIATMAAVIGTRFDATLLEGAEDEHPAVVEVALELLLERWLVRQHREQWHPTGLESSLALWSRGARRGRFEFDHPRIRAAIYHDLNPLRRQVLHRQVAQALERPSAAGPATPIEDVAHHWLEAGAWEPAFRALSLAAERAAAAGDDDGARQSWQLARRVLDRLVQQAADDDERRRWRAAGAPLERALADLDP